MAMKEIVEAVQASEARLLARLRELVEIESPSEDKAAVDMAGKVVEGWIKAPFFKLIRHKNAHYGDVLGIQIPP